MSESRDRVRPNDPRGERHGTNQPYVGGGSERVEQSASNLFDELRGCEEETAPFQDWQGIPMPALSDELAVGGDGVGVASGAEIILAVLAATGELNARLHGRAPIDGVMGLRCPGDRTGQGQGKGELVAVEVDWLSLATARVGINPADSDAQRKAERELMAGKHQCRVCVSLLFQNSRSGCPFDGKPVVAEGVAAAVNAWADLECDRRIDRLRRLPLRAHGSLRRRNQPLRDPTIHGQALSIAWGELQGSAQATGKGARPRPDYIALVLLAPVNVTGARAGMQKVVAANDKGAPRALGMPDRAVYSVPRSGGGKKQMPGAQTGTWRQPPGDAVYVVGGPRDAPMPDAGPPAGDAPSERGSLASWAMPSASDVAAMPAEIVSAIAGDLARRDPWAAGPGLQSGMRGAWAPASILRDAADDMGVRAFDLRQHMTVMNQQPGLVAGMRATGPFVAPRQLGRANGSPPAGSSAGDRPPPGHGLHSSIMELRCHLQSQVPWFPEFFAKRDNAPVVGECASDSFSFYKPRGLANETAPCDVVALGRDGRAAILQCESNLAAGAGWPGRVLLWAVFRDGLAARRESVSCGEYMRIRSAWAAREGQTSLVWPEFRVFVTGAAHRVWFEVVNAIASAAAQECLLMFQRVFAILGSISAFTASVGQLPTETSFQVPDLWVIDRDPFVNEERKARRASWGGTAMAQGLIAWTLDMRRRKSLRVADIARARSPMNEAAVSVAGKIRAMLAGKLSMLVGVGSNFNLLGFARPVYSAMPREADARATQMEYLAVYIAAGSGKRRLRDAWSRTPARARASTPTLDQWGAQIFAAVGVARGRWRRSDKRRGKSDVRRLYYLRMPICRAGGWGAFLQGMVAFIPRLVAVPFNFLGGPEPSLAMAAAEEELPDFDEDNDKEAKEEPKEGDDKKKGSYANIHAT
ncbi:unnamed protein product, partial [Prorocentrum cordatum]